MNRSVCSAVRSFVGFLSIPQNPVYNLVDHQLQQQIANQVSDYNQLSDQLDLENKFLFCFSIALQLRANTPADFEMPVSMKAILDRGINLFQDVRDPQYNELMSSYGMRPLGN